MTTQTFTNEIGIQAIVDMIEYYENLGYSHQEANLMARIEVKENSINNNKIK